MEKNVFEKNFLMKKMERKGNKNDETKTGNCSKKNEERKKFGAKISASTKLHSVKVQFVKEYS